ncbi:MAG: hypothetical protein NTX46_04695 [Chloroflexi bacterium]|nr:hypothetical protein [Chloroflexota bacterium]
MKVLKGFALGIMCLLLFLFLIVFGGAYTVNQTVLNVHWVVKTINDINFSQIMDEAFSEQDSSQGAQSDLQTAVVDTIKNMEPVIKERLHIALEDIYSYLKGKGDAPDLKETLSKSVMNADFVGQLLGKVDLSELFGEALKGQGGTGGDFSEAFTNAFINTIDELEPSIKQQIVNVADPVFKYLLQQTSTIGLKTTMRQTVFNASVMSEVIASLDFTAMAKDTLMGEIGGQLPQGIQLSDAQINRVVAAMEPYFKEGLTDAVDAVADYLVGARQSFSVRISFEPAMVTLKAVVKEAYLAKLGASLQGVPQAQIDQEFDNYFADFQQSLPSSFDLDSSNFGVGIPDQMSQALTKAQDGLTKARDRIDEVTSSFESNLREVRTYVGIFSLAFICVIALIVLMILGIILIHRNVKGACRDLGTVLFIYGVIFFAGIMIAKGILSQAFADIPQALHSLSGILVNGLTSPWQTISLVCLIAGVVLIVVAIVYPRLRKAKAAQPQ